MSRPRISLLAVVLLADGCMVGPDYRRPETPPAASWGESAAASSVAGAGSASPAVLAEWWTSLGDPILIELVDRAIAANLTLEEALARVRAARALRSIAAADLLPTVDADGSFTRARPSSNAVSPVGRGVHDVYQGGFDASWELDLFGGIRRGVEAADADVGAAEEDLHDALVSLVAEVARNYVSYRGAERELAIARTNVDSQNSTLKVTRKRFDAGLTSELDVTRAESQVATTAAQIPALETEANLAVHRLGVLLDQEQRSLEAKLAAEKPIPSASASVAVGVPSELLRRRPDIRRAERQLASATARIGVATADLYPRVSLLGSVGLESFRASDFFDPASKVYGAGPTLFWPIFDAGKIRSNIAVADAHEREVFAAYRLSILTAIEDVENALVSLDREKKRGEQLRIAVRANERSTALARNLYGEGLTDFLSVLDAERSLFESQNAVAQSDRAATLDLVALYKALGGGWEPSPQLASRSGLP